MGQGGPGIIAALWGLSILGGCVGVGEAQSQTGGPTGTVDAAGGATTSPEAFGSIRGLVIDDELRPLAGAGVALLTTNVAVETNGRGEYAILNLAPGAYNVAAQKLGYESAAKQAKVQAGLESWLNLTLVPLPVTGEAVYDTDVYTTVIECMVQTFVWVSTCSWPYELAYLTLHQYGVNASNYGLPPDIQRNQFRHNVSAGFGIQTVVSELEWKPTTTLAKKLRIVNCRHYDQIQDTCVERYGQVGGESPLLVHWKVPKAKLPQKPGDLFWYISAVWLQWGATTEAGLVFEQKVTLYNTRVYGTEAPEDWSLLQPKS